MVKVLLLWLFAINPAFARDNYRLVDGGFETWPGEEVFRNPPDGAWLGRDWHVATGKNPPMVDVLRNDFQPDSGRYTLRFIVHPWPGDTDYFKVWQRVFNPRLFTYTVVVRARARTSLKNAVRLWIEDGFKQVAGAVHSGSGDYETLEARMPIQPSRFKVYFVIEIAPGTQTGVVDVDSAGLQAEGLHVVDRFFERLYNLLAIASR